MGVILACSWAWVEMMEQRGEKIHSEGGVRERGVGHGYELGPLSQCNERRQLQI